MSLNTVMQFQFLDNNAWSWLHALLAFLFTAVGVRLLLKIIADRLEKFAKRTSTPLDDAAVGLIRKTKWWVLFIIGIYVAIRFLDIDPAATEWVQGFATIALFIQAGIWMSGVITAWIEHSRQRRLASSPAAATGLIAVSIVARIASWSIVLLLVLDNLGVNVTALVASLGVGGVAVALAVQNILGDLFASFSIVFDKPFGVGDFLIIDKYLGSVERVGLKTTRLRSLTGEQLVFSNSDLLASRIQNYGRMEERRVDFSIGVTYDTPRSELKRIPQMLQGVIDNQQQTRFDRAHFKSYGDFSLVFEIVYYVISPDYNLYMDIQESINLGIHEQFENEGIEFAYPTQTLFLKRSA